MLTFKDITDSVQSLIRGSTPKGMQKAVNMAMSLLASKYQPSFLVRKYYVNSNETNGPFTVYEDAAFTIVASFIEPFYSPENNNVRGLTTSDGYTVNFHLEDDKVVIPENPYTGQTLYFWCLKNPTPLVLDKLLSDTDSNYINYMSKPTEFPSYALLALSHQTAHFLSVDKRDFERANYFENKVETKYGPLLKSKASGDWGFDNPGDSSKDDNGRPLEWV